MLRAGIPFVWLSSAPSVWPCVGQRCGGFKARRPSACLDLAAFVAACGCCLRANEPCLRRVLPVVSVGLRLSRWKYCSFCFFCGLEYFFVWGRYRFAKTCVAKILTFPLSVVQNLLPRSNEYFDPAERLEKPTRQQEGYRQRCEQFNRSTCRHYFHYFCCFCRNDFSTVGNVLNWFLFGRTTTFGTSYTFCPVDTCFHSLLTWFCLFGPRVSFVDCLEGRPCINFWFLRLPDL